VLSTDEAQRQALPDFLSQLETMVVKIAGEQEKMVKVSVENRLDILPNLQKLKNPIIHLTRNAIDHGIEDRIERIEQGKPETARILYRFFIEKSRYIISIHDDGRGIDFDKVRRKAAEKGLLSEDSSQYGDGDLLRVLFSPGFSTKADADEISGRGAGLDVVHEEVKKLGGHISVTTTKGKGTRITISLPLEGEKT
jgi:two-component system chemotaxis sensor kinase CheA